MKTATQLITLDQAMAIAQSEFYDHQQWLAAERVFRRERLCPHCACHGEKVELGRLHDSTDETYAGRECPMCEEFVADPGQTHWCEQNHYDTDASGMCFSDADPGL